MFESARRAPSPGFAGVLILAVALAGCGPKRVDWMDGERVIGSIVIEGEGEGDVYRHTYRDLSGRRMRIERRSEEGRLLPRFAIQSFAYDEKGELSGVRFTDADGSLRLGPQGYARLAIERRATGEARIEDRTYFGPDDARTTLPDGYSRVETVQKTARRGMRQRFYDEQDRSTCPTVDALPDVCEVRFDYLQGVTPLTYKTLVSAEGRPLRKTRISGLIELDSATTTMRFYSDDGYVELREKSTTSR